MLNRFEANVRASFIYKSAIEEIIFNIIAICINGFVSFNHELLSKGFYHAINNLNF